MKSEEGWLKKKIKERVGNQNEWLEENKRRRAKVI